MKITVKERLNYLRERNLNIFCYDVTDIDEEALFSGADVDEYEEPDPADAFLALEDQHGTWLVTGNADDIMQYVDTHIQAEADRKAELK